MAITSNINLLQPTGFKVIIDRKKFGNVEYFAQQVDHPSVSANAAEVPRSRANIHMPADKLTFSPLSITILIDEDLTAYIEMYEWLQRLVNENYKTRTFADSDEFPSTMDITIVVLTSHNNVSKRIRYHDCIPVDLGSIAFQSTGVVSAITCPVTFSFTYFEIL